MSILRERRAGEKPALAELGNEYLRLDAEIGRHEAEIARCEARQRQLYRQFERTLDRTGRDTLRAGDAIVTRDACESLTIELACEAAGLAG